MSLAGLIYGPDFHYLDHLAPLCSLLEIPLIVSDESLVEQAKKFYPDLWTIFWTPQELPHKLVANFDTIIYSTPRVLFDEIFYFAQMMHQKRICTIWCPHGNSDKGRNTPFMEALQEEQLLLTYGSRIENFLKEKGVTAPTIRVGNYRFHYYKKNKKFYDSFFSRKRKSTLLYAPTWQDRESNSSFSRVWPLLVKAPKNLFLIVKLHPNLYIQYPKEVAYLEDSGVQLIKDFPPIYPILAKTDIYLGDMSSIGYDFLNFHKPLVLLSESGLSKIGRYVPPDQYEEIFEICEQMMNKKPDTRSLLEETFGCEKINYKKLKTSIKQFSKVANQL